MAHLDPIPGEKPTTQGDVGLDRLLIARSLLCDLIVAIESKDSALLEPESWERISDQMGYASDLLEGVIAERNPELVSSLWQPH